MEDGDAESKGRWWCFMVKNMKINAKERASTECPMPRAELFILIN